MITTTVTPDFVHGAAETEMTPRGRRPHRLPAWVRRQFPDPQLLMMESQPSGVRLRLTTASSRVHLVLHPTRLAYRGAERPRGRTDLVVDGGIVASEPLDGGDMILADLRTGTTELVAGPAHVVRFDDLPPGGKALEIWLPHNETVELVELRSDLPVSPGQTGRPVWRHYGSSISQGSNAASPARTWPAVAARLGDLDLHNLGLGGSAVLDPFVARAIRDSPADLISLKIGINVVNLDAMRLRAFVPAVHGFLDTVRDGHPDTPLILVSPIFCGIHEDTPGPGAVDPDSLGGGQVRFTATGDPGDVAAGRLTLRTIREALATVVQHRPDDPNLHHLAGTSLYGETDAATHPLPDALHPDTETHDLIGRRFAAYAFGPDGPGRPRPGSRP